MAQQQRRGGLGRTLIKFFWIFLCIGLLIALLRVFNWDPFGIINALFTWFGYVINHIADWWQSLPWFNNAVQGPAR